MYVCVCPCLSVKLHPGRLSGLLPPHPLPSPPPPPQRLPPGVQTVESGGFQTRRSISLMKKICRAGSFANMLCNTHTDCP